MKQAIQEEEPAKRNATLKSVNRALEVLEYIAGNPGRAIDISEGLDISWATLHRTLKQLEIGGFLSKSPNTNRYRVGSRMWFIGSTYIASHPFLEPARAHLNKAAKNSQITVQLVERSKFQATVLYNSNSENTVTRAAVGYHFPLHAGSKGQVLLAYSSPEFIKNYLKSDLVKLTANTETDTEKLIKRIEQIRTDGYAVTVADVQLFSGSMAAPVFNEENEIIACVCFVARKSVLQNEAKFEVLLEQLIETAQSISVALGWHPVANQSL